jgi:hypothetical protein
VGVNGSVPELDGFAQSLVEDHAQMILLSHERAVFLSHQQTTGTTPTALLRFAVL